MSARKTVSPILPSIAVVLAIAGVTTLLPLPVAFTDTAHAGKPHRGGPPPVTRSGVAQPGGPAQGANPRSAGPRERREDHTTPQVTRSGVAEPTKSPFGGRAIQGGYRIDLGLDFEPRGPRTQHQDHTQGRTPPPPRRQGGQR
jgi:hypothetical protein